jgi:tripartite-type tricarboxylate transporter receptor subunit TctC
MVCLPAGAQTAEVKNYPVRPVRMVNPSSPGGGADIIGRLVGAQFSKIFGRNFMTDNRPVAANIIATEIVVKFPLDGYTLLVAATGTFITNPLVYAKLPYADRDFETIAIGADVVGNTPEEFSAQIVREREVWAKVVKQAGITPK